MKATKYLQNISKSDQETEAEENIFRAEEASHQMDQDITATKRKLATAKKNLTDAERAYPFSSKTIVDAEMEIEGYELGLKKLESIKKRLFTEVPEESNQKG